MNPKSRTRFAGFAAVIALTTWAVVHYARNPEPGSSSAFHSPVPKGPCEGLANEFAALLRKTEERASEEDETKISQMVHALVDGNDQIGCKTRILSDAEKPPSCGRVYRAMMTSVFASKAASPRNIDRLLTFAPVDCQNIVLFLFPYLTDVDDGLAKTVQRMALSDSSSDRRRYAWAGLGTLAGVAREKKDLPLVQQMDNLILNHLTSATSEEDRVALLEAAGNGGCEGCAKTLQHATEDDSPAVRRVGVGAFRFLASKLSVDIMCNALEQDADASVREQAAWSLRFQSTFADNRIDCLIRAAANDASKIVRPAAVRSLGTLGKTFVRARSALVHLTGPQVSDDTREIAREIVVDLRDLLRNDDPAVLHSASRADAGKPTR